MKANVERERESKNQSRSSLFIYVTRQERERERDEDTGTPRHATESVGKRHTGRQFNCINGKGGRRKKESKERESKDARLHSISCLACRCLSGCTLGCSQCTTSTATVWFCSLIWVFLKRERLRRTAAAAATDSLMNSLKCIGSGSTKSAAPFQVLLSFFFPSFSAIAVANTFRKYLFVGCRRKKNHQHHWHH